MSLTVANRFHRLGFGLSDVVGATAWVEQVLGAAPVGGTINASRGPDRPPGTGGPSPGGMRWVGGIPFLFLAAGTDERDPVAAFLRRYGSAVHSLAWEIDDMWTTEHLLEERGIRITGVDVPGRHYFMHPRDTYGMLLEWTDTHIAGDPRAGNRPPGEGGGAVDVVALAWVTAAVTDADAASAFLVDIAGGTRVEGNPMGPDDVEHTIDVRVSDVTVRLVAPRSDQSRFAPTVAAGPRFHSAALQVRDLDAALAALEVEGAKVIDRDGPRAWTDPATTYGMPLEWTEAAVSASVQSV